MSDGLIESFSPNAPPPKEALDYFRGKEQKLGFSWQDVWQEEHIGSFTVAKALSLDVQTVIYKAVDKALVDGLPFEQFKKELIPKLQKLGWWGEVEMIDPKTGEKKLVKITPRRLQQIYETNISIAYAAGRWEKIWRTKIMFPYLAYQLGASREHRVDHREWAGLVLPVEHEFWRTHYPKNGWGCKCWVKQVTRLEYARMQKDGLTSGEFIPKLDSEGRPTGQVTPKIIAMKTEPPPTEMVEWENKRTGKKYFIPKGIDPGFAMNWGMRGGKCGDAASGKSDAKKSCSLLSKQQKLVESESDLKRAQQNLKSKVKPVADPSPAVTPETAKKLDAFDSAKVRQYTNELFADMYVEKRGKKKVTEITPIRARLSDDGLYIIIGEPGVSIQKPPVPSEEGFVAVENDVGDLVQSLEKMGFVLTAPVDYGTVEVFHVYKPMDGTPMPSAPPPKPTPKPKKPKPKPK